MPPLRSPWYRFACFTTLLVCPALFATQPGWAQLPWSVRMADAFMARHPDSIVVGGQLAGRWDYEQGLMLTALERVWTRTGEGRYYAYILREIDRYVAQDGHIRTYRPDDVNLDNLLPGRALLMLGQQTQGGRERYVKAAHRLREQLRQQPRTKAGGFWHKGRYPNQMWLDGLYMAAPFYAEYAQRYGSPADLADVVKQFALIEQHLVDPKTGLLYHGYDESRQQRWAHPQTGRSPSFWGRAMGWYAMALVDVLDYVPADYPQRKALIGYVRRLLPVLVHYQDKRSGCWYQVVDQGGRAGNYPEASATAMFVYALAKAVRMGYVDRALLANARRGYAGMLTQFVDTNPNGPPTLNGTVSVGGLGATGAPGRPYRDGSYAYYLSEPIRPNDLKGVGSFILASVELEIADEQATGRGRTVLLDYYFNNEYRNADTGRPGAPVPERYHYTWEDRTHSGFWLWGTTFRDFGAQTRALTTFPTAENLKGADVYIVVDPDTPKETAAPHYVRAEDADVVANWVRAGGVLVLMANDTANCEIPRFNELAGRFGIRFTDQNANAVAGTNWAQGRLDIPAGHPIFRNTDVIFIKDLATLALTAPAEPTLTAGGRVIMAVARYGKGTVFAVGDPWLYNEYTDGRRLPALYRNFRAAKDLAAWLLVQARNARPAAAGVTTGRP